MSKKTKTPLEYLKGVLEDRGCEEARSIIMDRDGARIVTDVGKPEEDYPDITLSTFVPKHRILEYEVYTIHDKIRTYIRVIRYKAPSDRVECRYSVHTRRE